MCLWELGTICTSSTQIRGELSFPQALRGAGRKSQNNPRVMGNVLSVVTDAQMLLTSITWLSTPLRAMDVSHSEPTFNNVHSTHVRTKVPRFPTQGTHAMGTHTEPLSYFATITQGYR